MISSGETKYEEEIIMEVRNFMLFIVLGDPPVGFGAMVPAIVESTRKKVIIISRKRVYENIDKCAMNGALDDTYQIVFANEEFRTLDDFLEHMDNTGVRVGVVSVFHSIFKEIIVKEINGGICFSVCRDGLFETYLPLLEGEVDRPTDIISFDNDKSIAERARNICQNPNIHIHKGVIHSSCVLDEIDLNNSTIKITCGLECILIFPPSMARYETYFPDCVLFGRSQWIFTKTEEEFEAYISLKLATINAIHTFSAIKAYVKGGSNNMTVEDMTSMRWADIMSLDELLDSCLQVQSILYDQHLAKSARILAFDKTACQMMTANFIRSVYENPKESLGRALNPIHSSFIAKVETHFPLLRGSSEEINEMLEKFMNLL